MKLPHPLRPPVPVLASASPSAPAPVSSAASVAPVSQSPVDRWIDPHALWALVALLIVALIGGWWLRRSRPQPRRMRDDAGVSATWRELETAAGAVDWYERFGRTMAVRQGESAVDHHRIARLLAALAAGDAGRPWRQVSRRWEWAIYAAHPGSEAEHLADLQLAKARWP